MCPLARNQTQTKKKETGGRKRRQPGMLSGVLWCGRVVLDEAFAGARAQQKGAKGGEERSGSKNN